MNHDLRVLLETISSALNHNNHPVRKWLEDRGLYRILKFAVDDALRSAAKAEMPRAA